MKISDLRIGVRLGLAFATVVALMMATIFIGVLRLQEANAKMDALVKERYSVISLSNQIKGVGYKANGIVAALALGASPERAQQLMDEYAGLRTANTQAYAQLEKSLQDDDAKAIYKDQIEARKAYGATVKQFFEFLRDLRQLLQ